MTTLAYILAGIGCGIPVLMLGLAVVTWRERRGDERAARQLSGWR